MAKMELVPLVYEPEVSDSNFSPATKAVRECFRVLFLGQVNLRKGGGRLLDAMRLLADEPIELVLAGPTEIDPSAWADLPNVQWLGAVPRGEVGRVYRDADVFILPTLSDGFAITQIEAIGHGLPVIASEFCGAVVESGRTGHLLDDLEPATIADAIRAARSQATKMLPIERERPTGIFGLAATLLRGNQE